MMPSGHKAFLVNNVNDVELLLMHNRTHAAEYVQPNTRRLQDVEREREKERESCAAQRRDELLTDICVSGLPTVSRRGSGSISLRAPSSWVSRSPTPRPRSPRRYELGKRGERKRNKKGNDITAQLGWPVGWRYMGQYRSGFVFGRLRFALYPGTGALHRDKQTGIPFSYDDGSAPVAGMTACI